MIFRRDKKGKGGDFEPLTRMEDRGGPGAGDAQPFRERYRGGGDERRPIAPEPPPLEIAPARPAEDPAPPPAPPAAASAEPKTRLYGFDADELGDGASDNPPAGWLVVLEGPGRGRSVEIGYGLNSVGRAAGQRIRLDFGDTHISRETHAHIVYDGRHRRFYVSHGDGENLTYLNGDLVLGEKRELKDRDEVQFGETKLMFVALCSEAFDWRSEAED